MTIKTTSQSARLGNRQVTAAPAPNSPDARHPALYATLQYVAAELEGRLEGLPDKFLITGLTPAATTMALLLESSRQIARLGELELLQRAIQRRLANEVTRLQQRNLL